MQVEEKLDAGNAALAAYLEKRVAGFRGPVHLTEFNQGQSNPTYLLRAADGNYVLRRKPPGDILASAHAVDREYRVIAALADTDVPVARAYHLCKDESILGSMFYLMSYEEGRIFWDPALPELAMDERQAVIEAQVKALAAIHNIDVDSVGLADFGGRGNYYERQISRWARQYRAAETEYIPAMEALLQWLPEQIPAEDGAVSLIHGDFRLDNLIFHPQKPEVRAILDWELSTLGHPYADVAYLCMCMRLPEVGSLKGLGGQDPHTLGIPSEEEMIRSYCRHRGIESIEDWDFYLAFSYFRIAAISQGVFRRAQLGNASDSAALSRGNAAPVLAGMGAELINCTVRKSHEPRKQT